MTSRTLRLALWVALFGAWSAALLVPIPKGAVKAVGGPDYSFIISKILHVGVYAVGALGAIWLPASRRTRLALIALLILHGPATEYLQQFVGRGTSLRDIALDWSGVAIGCLLGWRRLLDASGNEPQQHLQGDSPGEHSDARDLRQGQV